jgi:hypothetical protein
VDKNQEKNKMPFGLTETILGGMQGQAGVQGQAQSASAGGMSQQHWHEMVQRQQGLVYQAVQQMIAQQHSLGQRPATPSQTIPSFIDLLEEFNMAFKQGIREVVVTERIYQELMTHLVRINPGTIYNSQNMNILTLNVSSGRLTIRKEGDRSFSSDDFDKYMEEIDEKLP